MGDPKSTVGISEGKERERERSRLFGKKKKMMAEYFLSLKKDMNLQTHYKQIVKKTETKTGF